MLNRFLTTVVALAIGAAGGSLFYFLHLPLPWTLGAITATSIVAVTGGPWLLKAPARNFVRPVVGVLAGSSFTAALLARIADWWPAILLLIVYALIMMFVGYVFFRTTARFDKATAFFAAAPGGLGELTLLGSALGGDMRRLVLVHLIRILTVIFVVPFSLQIYLGHPIGRTALGAATGPVLTPLDWVVLSLCAFLGYLASRHVRFPAAPMMFPLILSMIVHVTGITQASPPPWLIAAVQVILGAVIGARLSGIRWRDTREVLLVGTTWSAIMLVAAAGAAYAGAWLLDRPFEGVLLALAPGGMVEMSIITYALGIDVAFVVTCQLTRILFVLLITPLVLRFIGKPASGSGTPT
jgi:membrane AbrB-like protein